MSADDAARARLAAIDPRELLPSAAVLAELLTPALVVHLDRVRANVRRVLELCGGAQRWRPHVKTSKLPVVQAELARAGVRRFKCATTRELAVLLDTLGGEGRDDADVLVAYPHVGPALARLAELARAWPRAAVSVLVEEAAAVGEVPAELGIFVDVNPGMDRTGQPLVERAAIAAAARAAGARFRGLHFYDGHRDERDLEARERRTHAGYDGLVELAAELARAGCAPAEVVTSGTPSFPAALRYAGWSRLAPPAVQRVSPGTVVYHDLRSEAQNPELGLVPAAVVLARVVSRPRERRVTLDAGSKSLAAEAGDPCAVAAGWPGLLAGPASEEHLPLDAVAGPLPERGEVLALVPRHVCPTVNLAEEALILDGGVAVGVAAVRARAHELGVPSLPRLAAIAGVGEGEGGG